MPLENKEHKCDKFPKGYTDLKIEFRKEAIDGWMWNLAVLDSVGIWDCFHIKFCPFCGEELDK